MGRRRAAWPRPKQLPNLLTFERILPLRAPLTHAEAHGKRKEKP